MTRIIQRCFVVLAFTGVILSTAQEAKVSENSDSTIQSTETPTSAPENSFNTAKTSTFYSSSDKIEESKKASFTEAAAAESSSNSEAMTTDVVQASRKDPSTSISEINADSFTTASNLNGNSTNNAQDVSDEELLQNASLSNAFTTELKDGFNTSEARLKSPHNAERISKEGTVESKHSSKTSEAGIDENKLTTDAAAKQNDHVTSLEYVSIDSGQSTVPSKEEIVSNPRYVDKNQTPGDVTSSAPSKVQNEESKSATHKRSLNATNSIISSTTVMSVNGTNSPAADSSSVNRSSTSSKLIEHEDESYFPTVLPSEHEVVSVSTSDHGAVGNNKPVDITPDSTKSKITSSPHSIINDNPYENINAGHIIESEFITSESSSSAYQKDASRSPVSLDALSILNEESIHPSESSYSTAQIANIRHLPSVSFIPQKSPNLEVEYEDSTSNFKSSVPLVTFDPDGLTNNYTQEPDSITFSPKTIYGKHTETYSSNLEYEESHSNKPELLPETLSTAFVTEVVGSSSHNNEGFYSSERERETPSADRGLLPHDEPDREVPFSRNTSVSTKRPEKIGSSSESKIANNNKVTVATNDESEEMLNDSPHFIENNKKQTVIPETEFTNKVSIKELENNISNDITHTSDAKSQDVFESPHELDFPIEYQTQQSEIRPVTEVSPIKSSEAVSDLPSLENTYFQILPNVTEFDHPITMSIPVSHHSIEPEPLPSSISKVLEKGTVTILPKMLPKDDIPPEMIPKDYVTPKDDVPAQLLPKDYVTPKILSIDNVPSDMLPKDYVTPKSIPIDNVPKEMLPTDFIPPELLPKDYVTPKTLTVEHIPSEMLPKDYLPPEMLPADYISSEKPPKDSNKPEMLPKEYVPTELLPKDYIPPHLLPKDYVSPDQSEQGNTTEMNSTIAGVAVKTSVSVSLPLSKSPNSTTSENSAKVISNSSSKKNDATPVSILTNKDNGGNISLAVTTEDPTSPTTESKVFRIRIPRPKSDSPTTARTRKPLLISLQKPSSTAGPPVSIFRKTRTRSPSITSSTTERPIPKFSTVRIHYASRAPGIVPGGEMVISVEPITTTVPTTTETEEPFSDEPFTGPTIGPVVPTEDNVTLLKVVGMIVVDKGLRWNDLLNNRFSPQYKEREKFVQSQLYRLFRTSPIAPQLWKVRIDGFSGKRNSQSVVIDFFLYLIKTQNEITPDQLVAVFHDKLINNTFSRFTVDTNKTTFEFLNEEPMRTTTPLPEEIHDPVIPQWAIAVIVVGAASLIFIVLFAAVAILGRHHVRRRYSNKLNDEDSDRPSDWESKMAAAYENLAADTIYDAEDFHSDSYKKSYLVD